LSDFNFFEKYKWLYDIFDKKLDEKLQKNYDYLSDSSQVSFKLGLLHDLLERDFKNFFVSYNNSLKILLNNYYINHLAKFDFNIKNSTSKNDFIKLNADKLSINLEDIEKIYYTSHFIDFFARNNNTSEVFFLSNRNNKNSSCFCCESLKPAIAKGRLLHVWNEKKYLYAPYMGSTMFTSWELGRLGMIGSSDMIFNFLMKSYMKNLQFADINIAYDINKCTKCLPFNICPKIELTKENYNTEYLGKICFDKKIYVLTQTDWCMLLSAYRDSLYKYCKCDDGDFKWMLSNESSNIYCRQLIWLSKMINGGYTPYPEKECCNVFILKYKPWEDFYKYFDYTWWLGFTDFNWFTFSDSTWWPYKNYFEIKKNNLDLITKISDYDAYKSKFKSFLYAIHEKYDLNLTKDDIENLHPDALWQLIMLFYSALINAKPDYWYIKIIDECFYMKGYDIRLISEPIEDKYHSFLPQWVTTQKEYITLTSAKYNRINPFLPKNQNIDYMLMGSIKEGLFEKKGNNFILSNYNIDNNFLDQKQSLYNLLLNLKKNKISIYKDLVLFIENTYLFEEYSKILYKESSVRKFYIHEQVKNCFEKNKFFLIYLIFFQKIL